MIEKKSIIYLAIVLIAVLIIGVVVYFVFFKKEAVPEEPIVGEKTIEEIIEDLTAPESEEEIQVSDEVIQSLTALESEESPQEQSEEGEITGGVGQDIIDSLTAPE